MNRSETEEVNADVNPYPEAIYTVESIMKARPGITIESAESMRLTMVAHELEFQALLATEGIEGIAGVLEVFSRNPEYDDLLMYIDARLAMPVIQ